MNKKIVLLFAVASSAFFSAQSIEGTITDKSHQPSADTEILLTKENLKFLAITDEKGKFKIQLKEDGKYVLQIIKDGITTNTENITVKGDLFKNIEIKEETTLTEQKIEGVTMTAKKKLFERKVDRLVFNVENSVASQGIDAVEALAKTPMVRATDDAISIAGKSNVAIMVNDRLLNLSGQEMINYLKTLRSDDIAKIEVITTPPAKYEAEGKSGLINIVLKKNTSLGWNGSLQTSGSYYWNRPAVSTRSGASFNYQGKKLSITTNLSLGDNFWEQKSYNYLTGKGNSDYWNTDSKSSNNYRYKGGNVKGEYKINDKNLVGVNYNYSYSNPIEQAKNFTQRQNDDIQQNFYSDSDNRNIRKVHNATAFYDVKLDTLGSKLSLSANLMLNDANAKNLYNTITDITTSSFVNPISQYKIYSGQADLEKNFAKIKTESGVKFTSIKNDSYFNFFDIENGQNIRNTARSNDFFYNEQNYAAYASTSFKINDKWDAKAGLRYEYTNLEGISVNDNITTNIKYGKFFPTAYLSYKANDNNTFSVNYSRRISRPYFGNLNPFKYIISEFEYSTGNPYLLPTFSDNLEFGYVLKNNFNITAYYNYNKDNSDRIQIVDGLQKYSIVKNFYNEDQAGINISYNYNKLKWLESNIFVNGFYAKSKSYDPQAVAAPAGYGANFNLDNNFFLNKEKTFTLMLGLWSNIPNRSGNTYFYGNFSAYSGVKLNLMQKNLMINLYVNDLLNTNRSKGTEYYPNYNVEYYYKGITRNVYLSVTYKFGNNDIKGATKQVKFEESSRAGGGS
ncbi:outer membrane beta-barrel family protein [Chryseobacterium wangxinyae]|uniref:outer membrane beta-barrel family protein n=1 Tax=Chryseobacterium sp. CY353 TaxID=2997334 RepID=UPI00226F5BFA|nr:outer membrane beta-barrel family protein [Chryseobacterium sp. CY353]MCY0968634.1 outer membrane beta-barrel family protein [Chryseobacterium sp. CY353]